MWRIDICSTSQLSKPRRSETDGGFLSGRLIGCFRLLEQAQQLPEAVDRVDQEECPDDQ